MQPGGPGPPGADTGLRAAACCSSTARGLARTSVASRHQFSHLPSQARDSGRPCGKRRRGIEPQPGRRATNRRCRPGSLPPPEAAAAARRLRPRRERATVHAIGPAQLAELVRPKAHDQSRGDALAAKHQRQGAGEVLAVALRMAGDEFFDPIGGGVPRGFLQAVAEAARSPENGFPADGRRALGSSTGICDSPIQPRAKRARPGRSSAGQSKCTRSSARFPLGIQGDWTPSRNAVVASSNEKLARTCPSAGAAARSAS